MKIIQPQPSLTEQVYDAIADEISDGALPAGAHLVQEQLAARLGVSRQPIQQAMALLKADGMVEEIGRRDLEATQRHAAQMRTNAFDDEQLRPLTAKLVLRKLRLFRFLGIRIGQIVVGILQPS